MAISCPPLGFPPDSLGFLSTSFVAAILATADLREASLFLFSSIVIFFFIGFFIHPPPVVRGQNGGSPPIYVGWFFHYRHPCLESIRKLFFNLKLNGEFLVTLLNLSHVIIKLVSDLDYSRVFCHRFYFVNNYYMKLTRWFLLLILATSIFSMYSSLSRLTIWASVKGRQCHR
ncbi:hypothetical protein IEQ34_002644 [Dendrobium chrysotoxum]|uniref:Uncharacterized protein n=1 Tax=Dendrobium chrysotoxum TaxID=161865 RepID=A0AAV7HF50_DENCH|nr:hypothetical protein IEQ34_002644 [Dendrobium chrysotoxum]